MMMPTSSKGLSSSGLFITLLCFLLIGAFHSESKAQSSQTTGTLKVLAVMVEFQPDSTTYTTGNGVFDTDSLAFLQDVHIDPLPHNQSYFEHHLEFAQNYFNKASYGQLQLDYTVLPTVYKLDKQIADYSPTGKTFTYEKLAMLVRDTWTKVDQGPDFDTSEFDENTAFVIFHAGVGRDIELIGTILDKTYQDIPSIYMSKKSLEKYPEVADFDNFSIKGNSLNISNSLIIPRTLSRRGEVFNEERVVSFSINGLLCASLGSHLGLPDLFDTKTGQSGIGRFGLMDGASFILSYNGLFPPLPSAWERMYLGWDQPKTVRSADAGTTQSLVAAEKALEANETHIIKYNISNSEYFLFENRFRDLDDEGVTLTFKKNDGSIEQQHFTNSDTLFTNMFTDYDTTLVTGVLVNVDNYDYAIPGGLDFGYDGKAFTSDDDTLNGGIIVWHVDEGIINEHLESNSINAGNHYKGVYMMEADAAQDIGRPLDGALVSFDSGHAYDLWWSGNNYHIITTTQDTIYVYENEFGPNSTPSSKSNSGANSFFEAFNFSDNQETASFEFRIVNENHIQKVETPFLVSTQSLAQEATNENTLIPTITVSPSADINNPDYLFQLDNEIQFIPRSGTLNSFQSITYANGVQSSAAFTDPNNSNNTILLVLSKPSNGRSTIRFIDTNNTINQYSTSFEVTEYSQIIRDNAGSIRISGTDKVIDLNTFRVINGDGYGAQLNENSAMIVTNNGVEFSYERATQSIPELANATISSVYNLSVLNDEINPSYYLNLDQKHYVINAINGEIVFSWNTADSDKPTHALLHSPTIYDINKDGQNDIILPDSSGRYILAYHSSGSLIDNFPMDAGIDKHIVSGISLVDVDGNDEQDYVYLVADSSSVTLVAKEQNGNTIEGFPVSLGASLQDFDLVPTQLAIDKANKRILAADMSGNVSVWYLEQMGDVAWENYYSNSQTRFINVSMSNGSGSTPGNLEVLAKSETYNWPNPANEFTHIRYQSQNGATIKIQVMTPSGSVIYKTEIQANSSLPEEIQLNTQSWPSGVYLARIVADYNGQNNSKIIKIAVVH